MNRVRNWASQLDRRLRASVGGAVSFRNRHGWGPLLIYLVCVWRWLPWLFPMTRQPPALQELGCRPNTLPFGVNIIGSVYGAGSFSEVARLTAEAFRSVDVPFVLNASDADHARREPLNFPLSDTNPYRFNLIITGIDPIQDVGWRLGRNYKLGRYNILLAPWEHEDIPAHLRKNLLGHVEIWAPSSFVVASFAKVAPVPVICVPHPMRPRPLPSGPRSALLADLPRDAFVFLFVFSFLRISRGRKSPESAIAAFKLAFRPDDAAALVIKADFTGARRELAELRELAAGYDNIRILDARLDRGDLDGLIASCDCYLSLHRSEGFGMTMAEAMAFGKPVVATRYGGNLEFMTEENSFLVDYELVRVAPRFGVRRRGLLWAQPDVVHAARLMRRVYEEREEAQRKGERARADVARLLSLQAVGELMKQRLQAIGERATGGG